MTNFHFFNYYVPSVSHQHRWQKLYGAFFACAVDAASCWSVHSFFANTFGKNTLSSKQQPAIFTTETLAWQNTQSPFFLFCSCKDGHTSLFFECCTAYRIEPRRFCLQVIFMNHFFISPWWRISIFLLLCPINVSLTPVTKIIWCLSCLCCWQ